jgi:hypothetical protein
MCMPYIYISFYLVWKNCKETKRKIKNKNQQGSNWWVAFWQKKKKTNWSASIPWLGGEPLGLRLAVSVYDCTWFLVKLISLCTCGLSCRSLRASTCRFGFADGMRRTCRAWLINERAFRTLGLGHQSIPPAPPYLMLYDFSSPPHNSLPSSHYARRRERPQAHTLTHCTYPTRSSPIPSISLSILGKIYVHNFSFLEYIHINSIHNFSYNNLYIYFFITIFYAHNLFPNNKLCT